MLFKLMLWIVLLISGSLITHVVCLLRQYDIIMMLVMAYNDFDYSDVYNFLVNIYLGFKHHHHVFSV